MVASMSARARCSSARCCCGSMHGGAGAVIFRPALGSCRTHYGIRLGRCRGGHLLATGWRALGLCHDSSLTCIYSRGCRHVSLAVHSMTLRFAWIYVGCRCGTSHAAQRLGGSLWDECDQGRHGGGPDRLGGVRRGNCIDIGCQHRTRPSKLKSHPIITMLAIMQHSLHRVYPRTTRPQPSWCVSLRFWHRAGAHPRDGAQHRLH